MFGTHNNGGHKQVVVQQQYVHAVLSVCAVSTIMQACQTQHTVQTIHLNIKMHTAYVGLPPSMHNYDVSIFNLTVCIND